MEWSDGLTWLPNHGEYGHREKEKFTKNTFRDLNLHWRHLAEQGNHRTWVSDHNIVTDCEKRNYLSAERDLRDVFTRQEISRGDVRDHVITTRWICAVGNHIIVRGGFYLSFRGIFEIMELRFLLWSWELWCWGMMVWLFLQAWGCVLDPLSLQN